MPFFSQLQQTVAKHRKDIYIFDPAHDITFASVRGLLTVTPAVGSFFAAPMGPLLAMKSLLKERKSRRDFIKAGLWTGAAIAAGLEMKGFFDLENGDPSPLVLEPSFRRIVVAKGIANLGSSIEDKDPSKNLLMIYPPVHWKGIKTLLQNKTELDAAFILASSGKIVPNDGIRESLYSARQYSWDGHQWKLKRRKPIE